MSKSFWQQKLQSSLQQSLQTVNSTVSSISSDGAARLYSCDARQPASMSCMMGRVLCCLQQVLTSWS